MNLNHNGSLQNVLLANSRNRIEPEVGMGGTLVYWTDRHACTVAVVHGPDLIEVQQDHAVRVDKNGLSESQTYTFERDANAPLRLFKRDRKGWWRRAERRPDGRIVFLETVAGLQICARNQYEDPHF